MSTGPPNPDPGGPEPAGAAPQTLDPGSTGLASAAARSGGGWRRLHPLSPVVRSGRLVAGLLAVFTASTPVARDGGSGFGRVRAVDVAVVAVIAAAGFVQWLVTRWKLDGVTLRIETGLLRRDSRQLPVARIQAVDLVRPFLARTLGLTELRIRLAGSNHADGRLAYLPESVATGLRARLLAAHHGLDPATPEPAERLVATVPLGRLVGSVALSGASLAALLAIAMLVMTRVSAVAATATGGTLAGYLLLLASVAWRAVATQYGFTLSCSGDGIRIRRGLLATVAETIPFRRVQAVRMIQPLLWRPLRWCRLEVDVAGHAGREGEGPGEARKALLPVGPAWMAHQVLQAVLGGYPPELSRPPRRARWKAPLSYHYLAAGYHEAMAMAVTGRVRRITTWLPLEKAQSVRLVQGPLQRALALATVHVDAAGRRVRAEFRERPAGEADRMVGVLAALSRGARARVPDELPGFRPAPPL